MSYDRRMPVLLPPPDLARADAMLSGAQPVDVLRWVQDRFAPDSIVVTASFEDPVLVHACATALPDTPIVLLDTQYLFAETHWYARILQRRLGFTLQVIHPEVEPDDLW